jgi:hypothetical protein
METLSSPPEKKHLIAPTIWQKYGKYQWLVIAFLLVVIGIEGFYIAANNIQTPSQPSLNIAPLSSTLPSPTITPNILATPDHVLTANWRTFKSEWGYSLKYPPNMYLRETGNALVYLSNFQGDVFGGDEPPDPKYNKGIFLVNIVDSNFNDASVSDYLDEWWTDYKRDSIPPVPPRAMGIVMIGDIQAVKTENSVVSHIVDGGKVISYYFTREIESTFEDGYIFKHTLLYQVDFQYGSEEENPELSAVFNQILSTFKFTD